MEPLLCPLPSLLTCIRMHYECPLLYHDYTVEECVMDGILHSQLHIETTKAAIAKLEEILEQKLKLSKGLDVQSEHSLAPIDWKSWRIDSYPVFTLATDTTSYQMTEVFSIQLGKADNFVRLKVSVSRVQRILPLSLDACPTTAEFCECLMLMQARKRINQKVANWSLSQFEWNEQKDYEMVAKLLLCVLSDNN